MEGKLPALKKLVLHWYLSESLEADIEQILSRPTFREPVGAPESESRLSTISRISIQFLRVRGRSKFQESATLECRVMTLRL